MRYCQECILPDTRPNLKLNEKGVCNACETHKRRTGIDWNAREQAFQKVVEHAKARSKGYDCLIPVSGGKDSTWQVVKCLEYGLKPLAVTWKPPARTEIGRKNLENLIHLGVDHIDYQISPQVERKFLYEALSRLGAPGLPMHMALFNIPLKIAVKFGIPLVVWGENSAFEYGSPDESFIGFQLDSRWLRQFGVMHGTTAKDWVSESLTEKDLTPYFGPSDEELEKAGVLAIFLGYYFPWDPYQTYQVAKRHGFQTSSDGAKVGYYEFADLDDDFISVHHYLKWYKFGFTRSFDNLSLEIRFGRLTRQQAIELLSKRGDETPYADIEKFCQFLGITSQHFFKLIEKFRNPNIWKKKNGKWVIEDFLIPNWRWE